MSKVDVEILKMNIDTDNNSEYEYGRSEEWIELFQRDIVARYVEDDNTNILYHIEGKSINDDDIQEKKQKSWSKDNWNYTCTSGVIDVPDNMIAVQKRCRCIAKRGSYIDLIDRGVRVLALDENSLFVNEIGEK